MLTKNCNGKVYKCVCTMYVCRKVPFTNTGQEIVSIRNDMDADKKLQWEGI